MRKLHKAAVVVALLGSVGFVGAGTAAANGGKGGPDIDVTQTTNCKTHDLNLNLNLDLLDLLDGAVFGEADDNFTTVQGGNRCHAEAF
ncbi:hypothetical protein IHE55_19950 [Streptomyces pactum]|uniref:Secreted protein n=1 Tax=Streptomyces pactum TaxID=68249 RepID=A0ABS0NNY7_9ACTN|nr:hypothetical protein [Streptomyces pactum]MBH5336914.1 hypothetical protein [Streptomyces pactum]